MKLIPRILLLCIAFIIISHVAVSQTVTPINDGDIYTLEVGNVTFEADASFGGRVTSFTINGEEILFMNSNYGDMVGSILWPSPQDWPWPPSKTLDSDPYTGGINGNKIILTSGEDEAMHLIFRKIYYADTEDTTVTLQYSIINNGSSATSKAAWEVTRVDAGGLSFFPTGDNDAWNKLATYLEFENDISWYEFSNSHIGDRKFMSDGKEGWFAHVSESNLLFIKHFEDVPNDNQAPAENEIELYLMSDHSYIELENQSEYIEIQPGDSLVYTVKWYLRTLPESVDVSVGSTFLASYVRQVLGLEDPGTDAIYLNEYSNSNIKVYPNPSSDYLRFINLPEGEYTIDIFTVSGKKVLSSQISSDNNYISIKELNTGVYLYSIYSKGEVYRGKINVK